MKLTKTTFAATFAALLIGGLTMTPASAAVRTTGDSWVDLSFTTHSQTAVAANPFSATPNHTYSRADISSLTHRNLTGVTTSRLTTGNHGWSDISSITHQ